MQNSKEHREQWNSGPINSKDLDGEYSLPFKVRSALKNDGHSSLFFSFLFFLIRMFQGNFSFHLFVFVHEVSKHINLYSLVYNLVLGSGCSSLWSKRERISFLNFWAVNGSFVPSFLIINRHWQMATTLY